MYPIKAPAVYIHQRVMDDPKCMARMERMMSCIESTEPPKVVNDEELDAISKGRNWQGIAGKRTGEINRIGDPDIVFNRFRWVEADDIKKLKERFPNISSHYFLGDGAWNYRNGRATLQTQHGICQNAYVLHCPHIRGAHNEVIYMVGSARESMWEQQCEFGRILEAIQTGTLVYRASDNLPFGTAWNTGQNYGTGKSCGRWASELNGIKLATSFEIPYANASGKMVTAETARAFGRDLVCAMRRFLQNP